MEEERVTTPQAHPMPGWLSMIPIPGSIEGRKEPEQHEVNFMGIRTVAVDLLSAQPGVEAGVVIEVGNVPEPYSETFSQGDKVYYSADRGVQIGDYEFIQVTSVIGWVEGDSLG